MFSAEEIALANELVATQNNLNQLVKLAHIGGFQSQLTELYAFIDEVSELFKKYKK